MTIPIGARVLVAIPSKEMIPNNPLKKLNGKEFVVRNFKIVDTGINKTSKRTYYTLDGAESKKGIPYSFLEEELIVL